MTHPTPEQLSLHLDGELDPVSARDVAGHLETCQACARLLSELRQVVARAAALENRPPRSDLWPGVAAAIGAPARQGRRVTLSVPQLLAAGIALVLLSGGGVFAALGRTSAQPRPEVAAGPATIRAVSAPSDRGYEAAIRELQAELDAGRGRLDTTTVRVVEEKLRLVNHAILEAERALAADPANAYLTGHLTQTRMRKLELLRRVTALTRTVS
jgi:hypothetical protein